MRQGWMVAMTELPALEMAADNQELESAHGHQI
jgi:hypothetical protein